MIRNVDNFRWQCVTKEGIIHIDNKSDEFADENRNNPRHSDKSENDRQADSISMTLVDIIEELYAVMALENIDMYDNMDKAAALAQLEMLTDDYHMLLRLKQIYYTEVQSSIDRINHYCDKKEIEDDFFINKIMYDVRHRENINLLLEDFIHHHHFALEQIYFDNFKNYKRMFEAVMDLLIYGSEHDLYSYEPGTIKVWFQLCHTCQKDKKLGIYGELIWLYFLLYVFRAACGEDENSEWPDIIEERNWQTRLNDDIEQTTQIVEKRLNSEITDFQNRMLFCYMQSAMEPDIFDKKIGNLVEALNDLKKEYSNLGKYLKKNSQGCIAVMHSDSKRYAAISGHEYANRYTHDIQRILGPEYVMVDLNGYVRYYHTKKAYVSYGDYVKWKNQVGFNEDDEKYSYVKRMFSCCERKLLTQLYGKKNVKYTIYVNKKVCKMCDKALNDFDSTQNSKGLIKYPKILTHEKRKTAEMKWDEIAKCIRNGRTPVAAGTSIPK